MKKISVMVVAVLFSASVFANGAGLPKKGTTVNGNKPKTEIKKEHKQKDKGAAKEKKASKKSSKKPVEKK
jgi:Ni/Co efflux regulator RcnB